MMTRKPMVAGNWKLNGDQVKTRVLLDGIQSELDGLDDVEIVVMPPFVYLSQAADHIKASPLKLGAQDVSPHISGAYTGETSAEMLTEFGCEYVLVGHSERRALFGDSDSIVVEKFISAQRANLTPVLCLGETLEQRQSNITEAVIERQLSAILDQVGVNGFSNAVIAYEPVWAIGTGETATPAQAQAVHAFIRGTIAELDVRIADGLRILYGGSVKPDNAVELFNQIDIDGGLIGGAALQSDDFIAICQAARQCVPIDVK